MGLKNMDSESLRPSRDRAPGEVPMTEEQQKQLAEELKAMNEQYDKDLAESNAKFDAIEAEGKVANDQLIAEKRKELGLE